MHKWKLALTETVVVAALVVLSTMGRLMWHPAQVAPVAAAALFAGYFLRSRLVALIVPLVSMAISDAFIGPYNLKIMVAVYAGLGLPIALAYVLRKEVTIGRLVGCSLASSMAFFFISNGAEWAFGSLYTRDAEGLQQCFVNALPFLRNTIAGDLLWTSALFAVHGLIVNRLRMTPPEFDVYDTPVPVKVRR
jgi:hypothetical protein